MTASKTRAEFEAWFSTSRKSKGANRSLNFASMDEQPQCYADDHTQRHWWTWQAARRATLEEAAKVLEARIMGDNNREDQEADRCAAAIRALGDEGMKP